MGKNVSLKKEKEEQILLTNGNLHEKIDAHKKCLQHWAFSVFLFNSKRELLLQKRSLKKYHSGGLWSNTCCGHFCNKEELENKEKKVLKRLNEEIGINCNFKLKLKQIAIYTYNRSVNNGLFENEIDYIFTCFFNENIENIVRNLNKSEVEDVNFANLKYLEEDIKNNPNLYSVWFRDIISNGIVNSI